MHGMQRNAMKSVLIRMSLLAILVISWIISVPERGFSFTGLIVFGAFVAYWLGYEAVRYWKDRKGK